MAKWEARDDLARESVSDGAGDGRVVKPYYEQDGITIYHSDCREILPGLPRESADLLLTDPPYGVGFDYGDTLARPDFVHGYIEWLWPIVEVAESKVGDGGHCLVFQSGKHCREWAQWFPRPWRIVSLPKMFVQMNTSFVTWATDYCLFWPKGTAPKGRKEWQPAPARDWFVSKDSCIPRVGPEKDHPCPRPPDIMRYLVSVFAAPGQTILDPFMGSGTTLRAAKDLGRKAIGIEIDERYCEIAARRMRQRVLEFSHKEQNNGDHD